jgi:hypothetical protein
MCLQMQFLLKPDKSNGNFTRNAFLHVSRALLRYLSEREVFLAKGAERRLSKQYFYKPVGFRDNERLLPWAYIS